MAHVLLALLANPVSRVDAAVVESEPPMDRSAFARAIDAHQADILRYCTGFLGDPALAADVAQEVFATLWKERERYRERGKLRHWLLRTARLRCLAETKRRRSRDRLATIYAAEPRERAVEPSAPESPALAAAIAALKPEHRDLVVMRYLGELELAEIAEIAKLRIGTVKSRLSRAVAALRAELADD